MADCLITAAPVTVCGDKTKKGGIKNIWLANAREIAAVTYDGTFKVITTITLADVANKFHKLDPKVFSAEYKESTKITNGIAEVTQSLEFFIHAQATEITGLAPFTDPTTAVIQFLDLLADNDGVIVIWQDYSGNLGNYYVAGVWAGEDDDYTKFAMKLASDEYTSGKALTDVNGDTVTLNATVPVKRYVFSGDIDESESV